jgi:hypothetical protein
VTILEQTLPINYLLLATIHYNIAKTFHEFHQYQKAIEHTTRAIDMINHTEEPNCSQKQEYQDYLNELQQKL